MARFFIDDSSLNVFLECQIQLASQEEIQMQVQLYPILVELETELENTDNKKKAVAMTLKAWF